MLAPRGRARTDRQRRAAEELGDRNVPVWMTNGTGRAIAAAFRRYLTHGDPKYITRALYRFLTTRMGLVAQFNLHNFRHVYRDPVVMLDALEDRREWHDARAGARTRDVYTDGLTNVEVRERLRAVVDDLGETARARSAAAQAETEIDFARSLAATSGPRATTDHRRGHA